MAKKVRKISRCLPVLHNSLNFIDINEALAMQFHVHKFVFLIYMYKLLKGAQHMRLLLSNMQIGM